MGQVADTLTRIGYYSAELQLSEKKVYKRPGLLFIHEFSDSDSDWTFGNLKEEKCRIV